MYSPQSGPLCRTRLRAPFAILPSKAFMTLPETPPLMFPGEQFLCESQDWGSLIRAPCGYPDQVSSIDSSEKSLEVCNVTWCYLALKIELQLVLLPPEAQTETKRTVEHPSSKFEVALRA